MAKPPLRQPYIDSDYTNRREVVASVVNFCNQTQEYVVGAPNQDVTLPASANTDDRMPLYYFRPAIAMLNSINSGHSLGLAPMAVPSDNLDWTGFLPLANAIIVYNNSVIGALP